jgi:hypothetical protein
MSIFQFHMPLTGSNVDRNNHVIRNVSLITGNLVAEGHDLRVDETTLSQILECGQKAGQVPVKLDHGSGVEKLCGFIENFHKVGNKVLGDWHLLESHGETERMMERAERMPACFGLSVAFAGKGVDIGGGKKAARCESLKAVDCVASPAANPGGLFSSREVDTQEIISMSTFKDPANPTAEEIQALVAENQTLRSENAQLYDAANAEEQEGQEITDEQLAHLAQLGDDQLAQHGIARNDVYDALAQRGYTIDDGSGEGEEGELAGAAAGAGESAALSALRRDVQEFKARENARAIEFAAAEEEHNFTVLEAKVDAVVAEHVQLSAKVKAQENLIKTFQSKAPSAAAVAGNKMELLFSAKEGSTEGAFETIVAQKFGELKTSGMTELDAKAKAIDFGVHNHPTEFSEYRSRGGMVKL